MVGVFVGDGDVGEVGDGGVVGGFLEEGPGVVEDGAGEPRVDEDFYAGGFVDEGGVV